MMSARVDVPRLLEELVSWEGTPWRHQGRDRNGLDCIGLAIVALAAQGVPITNAPDAYATNAGPALLLAGIEESGLVRRVPLGSQRMPGDVLAFRIRRLPQHLGFVLAEDRMIHAAMGVGVCSVTLSPLWRDRIIGHWTWKD